jgi:hypothetical protein
VRTERGIPVIDDLIKEGRSRFDRIQRHYGGGYERLSPAERISIPVLEAFIGLAGEML